MELGKTIYPRHLERRIREALADTPVVLITGPRQAGKTTLARQIASETMRYLTLDDPTVLLSAQNDPMGLVKSLDKAVIDEVQRAPALLSAIKKYVDEDRRPGRFLLTGSANLMALPTVAESLAGRMETLALYPLSQSEIHGSLNNWLDQAFNEGIPSPSRHSAQEALDAATAGGYPEALARTTSSRRAAWLRNYASSILLKDIADIATIDKLEALPVFLRALAHHSGQLCNYSQLGGQVGIDHKTAARYVAALERMFLLKRIEPWGANRLGRIIKTPKLHFVDSGLLCVLTGATAQKLSDNPSAFGSVLETFVFSELIKHAANSSGQEYHVMHYREKSGAEVDFVVEDSAGRIIGIEIKAASSVSKADLKGLQSLAENAGGNFVQGFVLYNGELSVPLGGRICAVPISTLWQA